MVNSVWPGDICLSVTCLIIGLDNGLVLNKLQAIIWTSDYSEPNKIHQSVKSTWLGSIQWHNFIEEFIGKDHILVIMPAISTQAEMG